MYPDLTPLQTSPLQGERLKTLIFTLLLPLLVGEGGWVGEVRRTHVLLGTQCRTLGWRVSKYVIFYT